MVRMIRGSMNNMTGGGYPQHIDSHFERSEKSLNDFVSLGFNRIIVNLNIYL